MARKSKYSVEVKSEILDKVRSGQSLGDVGKDYGIAPSTISGWLGRSSNGKRGDELEIGRLRRENDALLKIIGRMTYEEEFKKKKTFP
jgi:transposase-like protein